MRLSLPLVFLALVFAGCGSDDPESTTTATKSTPAATTAAETPTPAEAAPADGPVTVDIKGFEFAPETVTVPVGAKVTWTDSDKSNHNVVFKDEDGPKSINNIRPGEKKSVTFSEPGTYAYVCSYHPGMAGTVEVQ